jgi:hypothetical protein
MRRRIWKTFPIFLSCLAKWNFKLQLLPVERRFVHNYIFRNRLLTWQVQTGNSSEPTPHGRHEMASPQLLAVTLYSFYLI